jgi:hypothetical protein
MDMNGTRAATALKHECTQKPSRRTEPDGEREVGRVSPPHELATCLF